MSSIHIQNLGKKSKKMIKRKKEQKFAKKRQ